MSWGTARAVARALLYEGYLLYPYRRSGFKNQKRWAFGTLHPPALNRSERTMLTVEVLVRGPTPIGRVGLAFLQWAERTDPGRDPWLEGIERLIEAPPEPLASLGPAPKDLRFTLPAEAWTRDRSSYETNGLEGIIAMRAERVGREVWKLGVTVSNVSTAEGATGTRPDELGSMLSAHLLLESEAGGFVSLLDPPGDLADLARGCKNDGVWPVLVGEMGRSHRMLASPIYIYDYPAIAPESRGDFYDATEIDEMLALRVETLTDVEKEEARETDPRARALIDRNAKMSAAERLALHGARRSTAAGPPRAGDRVRLRPHPGRDVIDIALAGEFATVVSTEEDFEGRRYCTVTIDADPGRDLGLSGQPGHRFFFDLDELERLS